MSNPLHRNSLDVIRCEIDNNVLVSKSPSANFNSFSQLVVNESQEALFYKDGKALDLFGPGRHTLTTGNIPFIKRIYGAIFDGKTPFTCDVFFINRVSVLDMMWGTDAPVVLEDPRYHLIVGVRANGQTGLRVTDSRKFVVRVVGQLREFTVESVRRAIKGMMMTYIKEIIASTIIERKVSILEISTRLSELSELMQTRLNAALDDLGLEVVHFYVGGILAGDDDLAKLRAAKDKQLEVQTDVDLEAYRLRVLSQARANARAVEGYTYQDERKYDVLEAAAENTGTAGGMIGAGLGLGVGLGVMDETKKITTSSVAENAPASSASATRTCPNCGALASKGAKFCSECGQSLPPETKFCSECGNRLAPGSKFCPECGTRV